jgi:hypothetical protein
MSRDDLALISDEDREENLPIIQGSEFAKRNGLEMSDDAITYQQFLDANLPMVVACFGCDMTMTLLSPSCFVEDDPNGRFWCKDCVASSDVVVAES